MNILYVNAKNEWGGICSWYDQTSEGLTSKGHQVWVVAKYDGAFPAQTRFPDRVVPMRFGQNYNVLSIFRLIKLIRRLKIDLVVLNTPRELSMGGIAARLTRRPTVRRIGMPEDVFRKPRYRRLHHLYVDQSIIPGDNMKREILANAPQFPADSFHVVHNGRSIPNFSEAQVREKRNQLGYEESHVVIGCIARITESKGQHLTLEVFNRLAKVHDHARLLLVGDGPETEALQAQIADLGLQTKVNLYGFSNEPELLAAACDIHVSNSRAEGFSNSIVEAMACGKPIVATNVGGAAEILADGANGFLFEYGDLDVCEKLIANLIEDEGLRSRIGEEARKTVERDFSLAQMVEGVERVFNLAKSK